MEIQKSVIIIIKNGNKLFFLRNPQWKDISFVGGKFDDEDEDDPESAACREIFEELGLMNGIDYKLQTFNQPVINIEKFSQRTKSVKKYQFYPFFIIIKKEKVKERLSSGDNIWIDIDGITEYKDAEYPVAEIVFDILPLLNIAECDSYTSRGPDKIAIYEDIVRRSLTDEETPGVIDEFERRMLNLKKGELGISDTMAKNIEDAVTSSISKVACKIENGDSFGSLVERFPGIMNDLENYGKINRFESINILHKFNEGKTSALVFQIRAGKGSSRVDKILKYDYRYRIYKEYKNFNENEKFHGIYATKSKFYSSPSTGYAFLELLPADDYSNATEMKSLREIVIGEIARFSNDIHTRKYLIDSLKDIFDWLFRNIYVTRGSSSRIQKKVFPYQNSIDIFLPARRSYSGVVVSGSTALDRTRFRRVNKRSIASYDIKPLSGTGSTEVSFKVWLRQPKKVLYSRLDVVTMIDLDAHDIIGTVNWDLYIDISKPGVTPRRKFLKQLSEKYKYLFQIEGGEQLANIFKVLVPEDNFGTGFYLDKILAKAGVRHGRIIITILIR